ncbi:hypothetical protein MKY59_21440 [Paenibacillus sp. FSL W8-0426]|uniref:hypothetical protein n=1 Tax=Paenibacillus sp. FSL W8-0426 TaxID=2921714 RepID=UPI0030D827A4
MNDVLVEVMDRSEENDIVIYKFRAYSLCYLAEVEISSKKLLILRDYLQYIGGDSDGEIISGEFEYAVARKILKEQNLIG